jgi:hypothetical protein
MLSQTYGEAGAGFVAFAPSAVAERVRRSAVRS